MENPIPLPNDSDKDSFQSTYQLAELSVRNDPNTCIAIVKPDGLAFIKVSRESSILVEKWSSPQIVNINDNMSMSFCGNEADFRALSGYAKKQSARYQVIHESPISSVMIMKELSALLNQYTRMVGYRPFAANIVLGARGILYKINAGGEVFHYENNIQVLGDNSEHIEQLLTRDNVSSLSLDQAIDKCVSILHEVFTLQPGDIQVSRTGAEEAWAFTTTVI
ncbi:proteasome subunit alpha type-2-like [Diaphorina citri]|uniref:Proteasome subunit alpha type-2-like n=1 Tax=Diaphorina citri TaxID=121845 RepID=A0A3Q0J5G6_DIACI|nr:proteasome subunit alpha type-2-like [Diaphorina citri]